MNGVMSTNPQKKELNHQFNYSEKNQKIVRITYLYRNSFKMKCFKLKIQVQNYSIFMCILEDFNPTHSWTAWNFLDLNHKSKVW